MIPVCEWIVTNDIPKLAHPPVRYVPLETLDFGRRMEDVAAAGPCVLLLGRHPSDAELTEKLYQQIPENVVHIVANNAAIRFPKVSLMPIGVPEGTARGMRRIVHLEPVRMNRVLVCHGVPASNWKHHNPRREAYEYFGKQDWAYAPECLPGDEWLLQLRRHRFVCSPPGSGWDCDRTWQALYMGAYPIVLDNPFTQWLCALGLPLIKVARWEEATLDLLMNWSEKWDSGEWGWRHICLSYWVETLKTWSAKCRNQ